MLTIVSSYPYVLGDGVADAETVVWSSHGGQELGHGIVDVLSGDREAHRAARAELAGHRARRATSSTTTRSARARPTGISPTRRASPSVTAAPTGRVVYESVALEAPRPCRRRRRTGIAGFEPARARSTVRAVVRVRNAGDRDVEELVQVYVVPREALPIPTPRRLLVAYRRVRLAPGGVAGDGGRVRRRPSRGVGRRACACPAPPDDWLHAGALRVQPAVHPGVGPERVGPSGATELQVTTPPA